MEFLQKNQYHTDDPYVKELINEEIRKEIAVNLGQAENDQAKAKKGKSAHQQNLFNLKNNDGKFKYLWGEGESIEDVDYEEQERRKRDKQMQLVEPERFKLIGFINQKGRQRMKPILRMSDLYLSYNVKIRRIISRFFDQIIYGKSQSKKKEQNVILANSASNAHELQQILKHYQNQQQEYNLDNQKFEMGEEQLQEYIIDRNQSKQNYFIMYKETTHKTKDYHIKNNPINSENFLKRLHSEVRQLQSKYYAPEEVQSDDQDALERAEDEKKVKEYFGQFRKVGSRRAVQNIALEDTFQSKMRESEAVANSIVNYYSHVDKDIINQNYRLPLADNDKLELNLANPYFFQPKLHTMLQKEEEIFSNDQYKNRLDEANKNNPKGDNSISGDQIGFSKHHSVFDGEGHQYNEGEEDHLSIQKVIETEIKNVYKEPLKHSELAAKFQFVKFTLEEECFNQYHRFNFAFHEHLWSGRIKVDIFKHKNRKDESNGLVFNAEMKDSNGKFSRKEDLSLAKGEFALIQYIEQTPLLMSDVGMCERMFVQVNYLEILQRIKTEAINIKSLDEMEEQRDRRRSSHALNFERSCQLWRRFIRDIFGENGKQFYWEPKNNGKLIAIPQGPGIALMESNLCTIPIVRKKTHPKEIRDFLLVREGKRWVLRKLDSVYVSGQVEPHKKVFCPGSRQHTQFKLAYAKAFVLKQIREYGSVHIDQLKLAFKGETENAMRRALKNSNTTSKDSKNYKLASQGVKLTENDLTPEDLCLYERMQKSICELRDVGILDIRSNQKMKNVLKEFNRKHFLNQQKITLARMIRQQLQLTSWYLTDSFLKYKQKASKIEINGFADPTNGRGGYSYINKPQKERTSKEDMQDRAQKQKGSAQSDLRKLKVEDSKQRLRQMGHNQDEIQEKGRWALIKELKNKEGTEFSRRERETKNKKIENQKKQVSRNFNRLLNYLNDLTEEPAFDYTRQKKNRLQDYLKRERDYWQKIKNKFSRPSGADFKQENNSDESDDDE